MTRLLTTAALVFCLVAPARADVTITATSASAGLASSKATTVTHIKGMKLGTHTETGSSTSSSIVDLEAGTLTVIDHQKKEAERYDLKALRDELAKSAPGAPAVRLAPNGKTKTLIGHACRGYDVRVAVPFAPVPGQPASLTLVMAGPAWLADKAPGGADYAAFYTRAGEQGAFFGNPGEARKMPAQATTFAEMYRAIAATGGVPLSLELTMTIEGATGQFADALEAAPTTVVTTTVTSVVSASVGDQHFQVPPGYVVTPR